MLLHLILPETFQAQDAKFLSLSLTYPSLCQLCLLNQDLFEHFMSLIDAYWFVHNLYIRFLATLLLLSFLFYNLRLVLLASTTTTRRTSSTLELELLLLCE